MSKQQPTTHADKTPSQQIKKERVPAGMSKMSLPTSKGDPNYHYHVINDNRNGRNLREALEGGYEFAPSSGEEGTVHAKKGAKIDVKSGAAYLMRIPIELYKEDQVAKGALDDARMEQIHQAPEDTKYLQYQNRTRIV